MGGWDKSAIENDHDLLVFKTINKSTWKVKSTGYSMQIKNEEGEEIKYTNTDVEDFDVVFDPQFRHVYMSHDNFIKFDNVASVWGRSKE